MSNDKRERKLLAPLVIMCAAWAIRKSMNKTRSVIQNKRPEQTPKPKHEELAWKVGLAVALASAEALISSVMSKSKDEDEGAN